MLENVQSTVTDIKKNPKTVTCKVPVAIMFGGREIQKRNKTMSEGTTFDAEKQSKREIGSGGRRST